VLFLGWYFVFFLAMYWFSELTSRVAQCTDAEEQKQLVLALQIFKTSFKFVASAASFVVSLQFADTLFAEIRKDDAGGEATISAGAPDDETWNRILYSWAAFFALFFLSCLVYAATELASFTFAARATGLKPHHLNLTEKQREDVTAAETAKFLSDNVRGNMGWLIAMAFVRATQNHLLFTLGYGNADTPTLSWLVFCMLFFVCFVIINWTSHNHLGKASEVDTELGEGWEMELLEDAFDTGKFVAAGGERLVREAALW
jgi:hypothetical protein